MPEVDDSISDILVTSRSYEEYRAMFGLSERDLTGSVLDCPGGAASFTATAARRGIDAVAVDPSYAMDPQRLRAHIERNSERADAWIAANVHQFIWGFFRDFDTMRRLRGDSAAVFAEDYAARPRAYLAAELPRLPLPTGGFDLVLSSHLLFTYADRFDTEFHVAACRELVRVCRGEVRVYPLVDYTGNRRPELIASVLESLARHGITAERRPVSYQLQRGADELLVLRTTSDASAPRSRATPPR